MTRYRKKPVEVEAWQVGSDEPMPEWIDDLWTFNDGNEFQVDLDGDESFGVRKGEYIVKDGKYYHLLSAETFSRIYEAVNDAED